MNVIFLDIDGVLTQNSMSNVFNPKNVEALNTLLERLPDVWIVITSNRKITNKSYMYFKDLFNANLANSSRIIGLTPVLLIEDSNSGLITKISGRSAEIEKYIIDFFPRKKGAKIEKFAIIDDSPEELQIFADKLFITQFSTGLTPEIVEKIVEYFNEVKE